MVIDGIDGPVLRGNGIEDLDVEGAGIELQLAAGEDLGGPVDHNGNDGELGRERGVHKAFLEGLEAPVLAAGTFWPQPQTEPILRHESSHTVHGRDRTLSVRSIDHRMAGEHVQWPTPGT